MFKTWKSILNIHVARKMKADRLKCYLMSKLIWVLICHDITSVVEHSRWQKQGELMSFYKCVGLLKARAFELKQLLFKSGQRLKDWLMKITGILWKYAVKENKKGKPKLCDLLWL
jgi:hypothetical protein